jgi:hypothetical protein
MHILYVPVKESMRKLLNIYLNDNLTVIIWVEKFYCTL